MSIYKVNSNIPYSDKISLLNDMILELNGKIEQGKFNINEIQQIITDTAIDRKYLRNQSLGHTIGTYTGWTHLKAETGYGIWKYTPTTYTYNSLNKLYFDNQVVENRGEAGTESAAAFDKVFLYDGDSGTSYIDNTTEAGTEEGTEFELMDSSNDFLYVGLASTFAGVSFEFDSLGAAYTLKVEYYNGSSGDGWQELTTNVDNLDDDTSDFVSDGKISWTIPGDWSTVAVNGSTQYWVRISTTSEPSVVTKANYIIPYNSVPALLSMSSTQIFNEEWAWCTYSGVIYVTIRNAGNSLYEGDFYLLSSSSAAKKQDFFIYNHEFTSDYEDSTYVPA